MMVSLVLPLICGGLFVSQVAGRPAPEPWWHEASPSPCSESEAARIRGQSHSPEWSPPASTPPSGVGLPAWAMQPAESTPAVTSSWLSIHSPSAPATSRVLTPAWAWPPSSSATPTPSVSHSIAPFVPASSGPSFGGYQTSPLPSSTPKEVSPAVSVASPSASIHTSTTPSLSSPSSFSSTPSTSSTPTVSTTPSISSTPSAIRADTSPGLPSSSSSIAASGSFTSASHYDEDCEECQATGDFFSRPATTPSVSPTTGGYSTESDYEDCEDETSSSWSLSSWLASSLPTPTPAPTLAASSPAIFNGQPVTKPSPETSNSYWAGSWGSSSSSSFSSGSYWSGSWGSASSSGSIVGSNYSPSSTPSHETNTWTPSSPSSGTPVYQQPQPAASSSLAEQPNVRNPENGSPASSSTPAGGSDINSARATPSTAVPGYTPVYNSGSSSVAPSTITGGDSSGSSSGGSSSTGDYTPVYNAGTPSGPSATPLDSYDDCDEGPIITPSVSNPASVYDAAVTSVSIGASYTPVSGFGSPTTPSTAPSTAPEIEYVDCDQAGNPVASPSSVGSGMPNYAAASTPAMKEGSPIITPSKSSDDYEDCEESGSSTAAYGFVTPIQTPTPSGLVNAAAASTPLSRVALTPTTPAVPEASHGTDPIFSVLHQVMSSGISSTPTLVPTPTPTQSGAVQTLAASAVPSTSNTTVIKPISNKANSTAERDISACHALKDGVPNIPTNSWFVVNAVFENYTRVELTAAFGAIFIDAQQPDDYVCGPNPTDTCDEKQTLGFYVGDGPTLINSAVPGGQALYVRQKSGIIGYTRPHMEIPPGAKHIDDAEIDCPWDEFRLSTAPVYACPVTVKKMSGGYCTKPLKPADEESGTLSASFLDTSGSIDFEDGYGTDITAEFLGSLGSDNGYKLNKRFYIDVPSADASAPPAATPCPSLTSSAIIPAVSPSSAALPASTSIPALSSLPVFSTPSALATPSAPASASNIAVTTPAASASQSLSGSTAPAVRAASSGLPTARGESWTSTVLSAVWYEGCVPIALEAKYPSPTQDFDDVYCFSSAKTGLV
ncbi:hypothetical protein PYCC9005_000379 [Savitreella phatthalungensis]